MFYQMFFSPQVKRSVINSNKNGMYKLPQVLPNIFADEGAQCPHKKKKDFGS